MAGKYIVEPKTGSITYLGTSEKVKGNHENMPSRTNAYLKTDERGHIQASSLSGCNKSYNIVPQAADLNHGSYYSMEQGERMVLNHGGTVETEKVAYASNQPGNRPDAFLVNDVVTYDDGQRQEIHFSFSNLTNAEQDGMNAELEEQDVDIFNFVSNPDDALRDSMTAEEYTGLMEKTDAELLNITDMYEKHAEISIPTEPSYEPTVGQNESTVSWEYGTVSEAEIEIDEYSCETSELSIEDDGAGESMEMSVDDE